MTAHPITWSQKKSQICRYFSTVLHVKQGENHEEGLHLKKTVRATSNHTKQKYMGIYRKI